MRLFILSLLVSLVGYSQVIEREFGVAESFVIDLGVSSSHHIPKASSVHVTRVKLDLDKRMGLVSEPGGDYLLTNLDTESTTTEAGKLRVVYTGTIIFDMGTDSELVKDVMFIMGGNYIEFHLPYVDNSVYCVIYSEVKDGRL
jgi:hypothetical protein